MTPTETRKRFKREIYRNLHFDGHVYSVRKNGIVEGHALTVVLDGTTKHPTKFAVGPKGNQRVRDEKRKNVHAVIRGYMVNAVWHDENNPDILDACEHMKNREMDYVPSGYEWTQVIYDPYKHRSFMSTALDFDSPSIITQPIHTARKVIVDRAFVWALIPSEETLEEN